MHTNNYPIDLCHMNKDVTDSQCLEMMADEFIELLDIIYVDELHGMHSGSC